MRPVRVTKSIDVIAVAETQRFEEVASTIHGLERWIRELRGMLDWPVPTHSAEVDEPDVAETITSDEQVTGAGDR